MRGVPKIGHSLQLGMKRPEIAGWGDPEFAAKHGDESAGTGVSTEISGFGDAFLHGEELEGLLEAEAAAPGGKAQA